MLMMRRRRDGRKNDVMLLLRLFSVDRFVPTFVVGLIGAGIVVFLNFEKIGTLFRWIATTVLLIPVIALLLMARTLGGLSIP